MDMYITEQPNEGSRETRRPVTPSAKAQDPVKKYFVPEKRNGSVVLFKNPILEKFSHVHPITPLLFWTPVIAYFFWRSISVHELGLGMMAAFAFIGLFVWSFTEYVLHRWVFHFKPWSRNSAYVSYLIHWCHHDVPDDKTRLVMPPVGGVVLGVILYAFFRLFTGPVYIDPLFGFFLVGYLIYDYGHYAAHHFRPRTALGKYLKKNHMDHHYVYPDAYWGVSSPLWDFVFGTAAKPLRRAARQSPRETGHAGTA